MPFSPRQKKNIQVGGQNPVCLAWLGENSWIQPQVAAAKVKQRGGDPEPVGQGWAVGGYSGPPVLSTFILCTSWSAVPCWVCAFISGFYKLNPFSPGCCPHTTTHGHLGGGEAAPAWGFLFPECQMAAAGKQSRGGTPTPPGAPQRCLLLDCAEGSAGTGRRRWWGARRLGREEGDSPGRSWNGAGQRPGIRLESVQHRGFANPGVEGSRSEKPGCWRGPPGWLLAASAGVQRRRQDKPSRPRQTQGERAIPGTPAGCVPPREETSRGPGRGRRKTKRA